MCRLSCELTTYLIGTPFRNACKGNVTPVDPRSQNDCLQLSGDQAPTKGSGKTASADSQSSQTNRINSDDNGKRSASNSSGKNHSDEPC